MGTRVGGGGILEQVEGLGVQEGGLESRARRRGASGGRLLTVWCRSGMPILKTIMLKWASSRADMERPWRPPAEARLPGAPLPRPRVPWRPLPGPSGELSDSEPPSGHSLALWRSSSSLVAGLWVIVGTRGDGGRQHHRSLWGGGQGRPLPSEPQPSKGHRHTGRPRSQGQRASRCRRRAGPRPEAGHTPRRSGRLCTHPHLCHAASTCLLPCPWPCSQPPPRLRPTLPLGQRAAVPETAESPRELLAHFARPRKMQLKLAEDRQVDGPPAPCPPGPSLAPHPRPPTLSLAAGAGGWGTAGDRCMGLRCSKGNGEVS